MKYSNIIERSDGERLQKIDSVLSNFDDDLALQVKELYSVWEVGKSYETGERIRYNDVLYKVLQNHTSQADWTPDIAVSLYVRVGEGEYPEWVQPTGAHDAYNKGDKVSHNEKHWESLIDANVYEPTESVPTLWKEV